eukprot:jgi/Mesvir1/1521/Mv14504-RA.1
MDRPPSLFDVSASSSLDTDEKGRMTTRELIERLSDKRKSIENKFTPAAAKRKLETMGLAASENDAKRIIGETVFKCDRYWDNLDKTKGELYDKLNALRNPSAAKDLLEMFEAMENRVISAKEANKCACKCHMCKCEVTGPVYMIVGEADHGHSNIVCEGCAKQELDLIENNPEKFAVCPFCPNRQRLNLVPPYYQTSENVTKLVRKFRVEECPHACGTWTQARKMIEHIDWIHYFD